MNLDKKLNQVYQNGYVAGCERTHENWMQALQETPGVGRILEKRVRETMEKICRRKLHESGVK